MFPNCVTEAKGEDGNLKLAIDFDLLRQELTESIVEGLQERYQLNWPGKREALLTANAPIAKTLHPCREESVNFDTTQNFQDIQEISNYRSALYAAREHLKDYPIILSLGSVI